MAEFVPTAIPVHTADPVQTVHFLVPAGIDDPARPSGGNVYDRRMVTGLKALGWQVVEHPVAGGWPHRTHDDDAALAALLSGLAEGALVLVDGLIALPSASLPFHAGRLRVVVLVHMLFADLPFAELLDSEMHDGGTLMGLEQLGLESLEMEQTELERLELERLVLQCAAAVVATSLWTKRQIIQRHGVDSERIAVVEPGTDRVEPGTDRVEFGTGRVESGTESAKPETDRVQPGTERAELARASAEGGALLCVASVSAAKGHHTLINALTLAADCQWECTCVGALDLDPAFTTDLRHRAEKGGIGSRVHFTGALTATELATYYGAADVLVLASRSETYAMVITEALAHGIPVIATAVGGVPESLGRATSGTVPGLLVPPDDPAALAGALRRWLTDAKLRNSLRSAARERRETLENWDTAAGNLAEVLLALSAIGKFGGPATEAARAANVTRTERGPKSQSPKSQSPKSQAQKRQGKK